MPRRVSLPSADDLFRPTGDEGDPPPVSVRAVPDTPEEAVAEEGPRKPSGRIRHDEKMTVYVTSDELIDIEHTRLMLRRSRGMAVDRGRLVREAVALVLADFEANGDDSMLVRRLSDAT